MPAAVAQICQRLDGIPLAIELAAARLELSEPRANRRALGQRFRLLTGGAAPPCPGSRPCGLPSTGRQACNGVRTLLLQCLSVSAGGRTLELAEEVRGFDGVGGFEVLEGLGQLVKKSLAAAESQAGAECATICWRC